MRLNGTKKIITEDDINLSGSSLSERFESLQQLINELKSNVKWIYKYGGVGKGSGGSSTTSFSVYATLNGTLLKDLSLVLNGTNSYKLYIKINNPNGASFNVLYKYTTLNGNGTTSTLTNTLILTIDNNYTIDTVITLNNNDTLTVIASDGNDTKQVSCNYITTPYTFDLVLVNKDNVEYNNEEIFIDTAASKGLVPLLRYSIFINAEISYSYLFNGETVSGKLTDKNGVINFPIDSSLFISSNAGLYNAHLDLLIIPENLTPILLQIIKSFSLIPEDLYILLLPDTGSVYANEVSNPILYKPGYISFKCRIYEGINYNRTYSISILLNNVLVEKSEITERDLYAFKIFTNISGKNTLTLRINANIPYESTYYFYVDENTVLLNWLNNDWLYLYYYRITEVTDLFTQYKNKSYIQQTINSPEIEITGIQTPNTTGLGIVNTHIAFGLLYNTINSDNPTIIEFFNNQSSVPVLSISLQAVSRNNSTKEIYILKLKDANASVINNYHLIQIYSQFVKQLGNEIYYKLSVYIDGFLEAEMPSLVNAPLLIESFKILPVNCFINCIDIDYKQATGNCDYEVYNYYLKYQNVILGNANVADLLSLLSPLSKFLVLDNGRVIVNLEIIDNISQNIDTPTLVFTHENAADENILEWIEGLYGEDGTMPGNDREFLVTLSWSPGRTGTKAITFPSSWLGAMFKIRLQGSSTKNYRGKNFFLAADNADEDSDLVYLFSPNFNKDNKETFLPEFGFNLKADIVDSSHSNNTTCGKFVNTVCKKFNTNTDSKYSPYIRNCLEGFPILLYLQVVDKVGNETTSTFYYLGIYNFNLGRESYFNLGYRDLTILDLGTLENAGDGFTFFSITKDLDVNKPGLGVAEIQGGSPYFDFSQYDPSILFEQSTSSSETKDITYMFGDLVKGNGTSDVELRNAITLLVKSVALSGGYLFDYLKKNKGSYADGYNAEKIVDGIETGESLNQVPDYTTQYKRTIEAGSGSIYTPISDLKIHGTVQDLNDLLIPDLDSGKQARLDYLSIAEYYTICMTLGLVDSVMKNLNIKTWNLYTWFAAFYDMDTCLGLNNAGSDIEYFAFSDYWHGSSKTVGNIDYPDKTFIYRDFSPKSLGANGYDIPSSFLFAVAKYARLVLNSSDYDTWMSVYPQELYAKWRSNKINTTTHEGILRDADYFIDNFFSNNLGSICPALVSYNYRAKYLSLGGTTLYITNDYEKFHGTRINKVRNWLNGRLHILDVYFNLNKLMVNLLSYLENDTWKTLKIGGVPITDITYKGNYSISTNPDITIMHDILSEDDNSAGALLSGNIAFTVKCPKNSPLLIYNANNTISYNYIIGGENLLFIDLKTTGVQTVKLGGSQAWTYLLDINWINTNSLLINSDNLEAINGNEGSFSSMTLKTPNVKTIDLNSSKYSGLLTLNSQESYPNLNSINIAGSKMSLYCDNLNLKTLNISNINNTSSEITVKNCNTLEKFICSNSNLKSLTVRPINLSLSFTNCNINTYNLSCGIIDASINISNDKSVENITLVGFKDITIYNCPKLRKVTILLGSYSVENISIISCKNKTLTVITKNIDLEGTCDFSGLTTLKTLTLENTEEILALKCPDNVLLTKGACKGLIKLTTIDGKNILLNGNSIFQNCYSYNMRSSDGNYTDLKVINKDVSNLFYKQNPNSLLTIADVKHFIKDCLSSEVTEISYMFYGNRGISYQLEDFLNDLSNGTTNYIDLSKLTRVVNALCTFGNCSITCYNKNMLNFGGTLLNLSGFIDSYIDNDISNSYVTLDSLVNIITKVTSLFGTYNNNRHRFKFLDNRGQPLTGTIKLKDFFNPTNELGEVLHPSNLKTLSRFYLTKDLKFDLTNVFTEDWLSLTDISEFLWLRDLQYTGTEGLFNKLPKLNYLGFILLAPTNDESIDLYNIVSWSDFLNRGGKLSSGGYEYENFTIHKTIQLSDFLILCNLLLKSNVTSIAHIFCNCNILGVTTELTFGNSSIINTNITDLSRAFDNCKMINNSVEIPIPFSSTFFKNFSNIKVVPHLFKNTWWSKPIPFNLFNKRVINNNINRNVYVKIGDNYEEAILTEYTYNTDITDFSYLFYNTRWTANCMYYTPSESIPKNRVEKDGNTYDTYYTRNTHITENNEVYYTYIEHKVTQSSEITDALNLTGYYISQTALETTGSLSLYPNATIQTNAVNSLCIPPDLFYGADVNNTNYAYALACLTPLQGIIPENIFKANRNGSVRNTFLNLSIVPRLITTYKEDGKNINVYTHFPRNYTDVTNLDEAFNVNAILPLNDSNNINWVFIILKDSISLRVNSMDRAFTIPHRERLWWPTQKKTEDINYINYIGNVSDSGVITEGFDMQYFNLLTGDNLFYSNLNIFLHGHLFNSTFDLYNLPLANINSKVFSLNGEATGNNISNAILFPSASGSITFFFNESAIAEAMFVKSNLIPASSLQYYINAGLTINDE